MCLTGKLVAACEPTKVRMSVDEHPKRVRLSLHEWPETSLVGDVSERHGKGTNGAPKSD